MYLHNLELIEKGHVTATGIKHSLPVFLAVTSELDSKYDIIVLRTNDANHGTYVWW